MSAPCPRLRIEQLPDAASARAMTLRACLARGLGRRRASEAALVASELSTNMVKYASGGELELLLAPDGRVLWIVARDRGPGPPCREHLLSDGVSRGLARTPDIPIAHGLGSGGGAIGRFSDEVCIAAREGGGTEIRCAVHLPRASRQPTAP